MLQLGADGGSGHLRAGFATFLIVALAVSPVPLTVMLFGLRV